MKNYLALALLCACVITSCKKETIVDGEFDGKTTVSFNATVGTQDFALNKDFTIGARTYQFNTLRYWVGNIVLIRADNSEFIVPSSYYLLEETVSGVVPEHDYIEYPANKREDVLLTGIPAGDYKGIKYSVGVEKKYNTNLSLQSGELSQLNGMVNASWMWFTSYIFTTVRGTVKEGSDTKSFNAETGADYDASGVDANYKTVSISFPETIRISSKADRKIVVNVDIAKALDGIDLMATPNIGASTKEVMKNLANNYATKVFTAQSAQ